MATLYRPPHASQFDGSALARQNCTPTTGANGANAATGGLVARTGGEIRSLVARRDEQFPNTPGWSLDDLDLAMGRLGVPFEVQSGSGWAAVISALDGGLYVALQGDSDRFGNGTCSGAFDGDHCIGVHPTRGPNGTRWINDPICPSGRWERESLLEAYARKLHPAVRFGVFLALVPDQWPAAIGPRPAAASMWVETVELARIWRVTGPPLRRVLRPIEAITPGSFTFEAWAGPNTTRTWAPGPASPLRDSAVFRPILSGAHRGRYVRVSDYGATWHHLFRRGEL